MLVVLIIVAGFTIFITWAKVQASSKETFLPNIRNQPPSPSNTQQLSVPSRVRPPQPPAPKRYKSRKSVLTDAEIHFHRILLSAGPEAAIFPKVRVADVMDAEKRYSGDFLRISQKHFDWVLCHPRTFEPLVVIELDDSSHGLGRQKKNDRVKDDAAAEAGIALLRFPWSRSYDEDEVRDRIAAVVNRIADEKDPPRTEAPPVTSSQNVAAKVTAALETEVNKRRHA